MAPVDRRLIAIVATGGLVVAAILVIVFVAIIPVPEYLALQPGRQSGYVAYQVGDNDQTQSVKIVDLETLTPISVAVGDGVEIVGWHSDGSLLIHDWRAGDAYMHIDATTGEQIEILDSLPADFSYQTEAFVYNEGGMVVIELPIGTATFPAPESYDIGSAVALGDDHIVFVDELGRVAVANLGDDANPLLVASDAVEWSRVVARP